MSLRSRYHWYQFGNRLQVFFLGLLLGVVLTGGFFLLKLDHYVKELAQNNVLTGDQSKEQPDETTTGETDKTSPDNTKSHQDKRKVSTDEVIDTTVTDAAIDTGIVIDAGNPGDEIVVRQNELLGQKEVALVNLDGTKALDSIRTKEAGIKEESGKSLTVEFWKSPLNSKGYTMSRNRLVLFGFPAEEDVALYRVDNSMLMKTTAGVFRLENTADFRQMERVTDEALLAKLP